MITINTATLFSAVANDVNNITTATSSTNFLYTAISINLNSTDRTLFVDAAIDLPDIYQQRIPNGTLIFVKSINLHVIANNEKWYSLDGRVFRDDSPIITTQSWGSGSFGQLGDGTAVSKSSPVSVVGGFTNWCQISAGSNHTSAVRSNGSLWVWGYRGSGQLGDGTNVSKSSPVSVVGGFTDWCQVSTGGSHTTAVRSNGSLWAWGCNNLGRLGDGTAVSKSSPVSVVGGFTDWCQISAGYSHTAAVRTNGTLWAWGYGACGRLGDDTIVSKSSPALVSGGFTDWCQVSAGFSHNVARRINGSLWAWGLGTSGQLGDGTVISKSIPMLVSGGFTDWCQISAGGSHTTAVRSNGSLWAWGLGTNGQLGNGTVIATSSPVSVAGGFTDWCQVSAGCIHTAALRANGSLWVWGSGGSGQLGDGTSASKSSPVSVVGGFTNWCQVSSGGAHTVALRATP